MDTVDIHHSKPALRLAESSGCQYWYGIDGCSGRIISIATNAWASCLDQRNLGRFSNSYRPYGGSDNSIQQLIEAAWTWRRNRWVVDIAQHPHSDRTRMCVRRRYHDPRRVYSARVLDLHSRRTH
jgi:hypothetical protein